MMSVCPRGVDRCEMVRWDADDEERGPHVQVLLVALRMTMELERVKRWRDHKSPQHQHLQRRRQEPLAKEAQYWVR